MNASPIYPVKIPFFLRFRTSRPLKTIGLHWLQRFSFLPTPRHRIDFKAIHLRLAEQETIIRTGYSYYQRAEAEFRNYSLQYLSRTVGLLQVGGIHQLSEGTLVSWQGGYTASFREEPDFQRIRTVKEPGDTSYRIIIPPGATTFDAARFYSRLRQEGWALSAQLRTHLWGTEWQGGFQGDYRRHTFSARWFSYTLPPSAGSFLQSWASTPIQEAFSEEYLPNFRLREGTNPTDLYEAEQAFGAAFLSAEKTIARWRLQGASDMSTAISSSSPLPLRGLFPSLPLSPCFSPLPMWATT
jgi:hypothetical protein